jgi:copper(I)-binding protein
MKHQFAPALRRLLARTVPTLALLTAAACAGTTGAGPQIEVEGAWARPSLAPIGHMDDHDHLDHHGPGEVEEDHGAGHADAAAHHMSSGTTSAAYFVLHNRGGEADRLVAARTEVAGVVELHRSAIEDGVMRMRQVEAIEVPASGQMRLEPGGYHLMLIGVKRELRNGDRFPITLEFELSGTQVLEVEVEVGAR